MGGRMDSGVMVWGGLEVWGREREGGGDEG